MKHLLLVILSLAMFTSISAQSPTKADIPNHKETQTTKDIRKDEIQEKTLGDEGFHVERGTDVSQEGYGIFGSNTGSHIAIDTDDIQSKNGTGASYKTLYLNFYGGNTNISRILSVIPLNDRMTLRHFPSSTASSVSHLFTTDVSKNLEMGINNSNHPIEPDFGYIWNYDSGLRFGTSGTERLRIEPSGEALFQGDVTATKFIGDGSMLTNLPSTGGGGCNDYGDGSAGVPTISGQTVDWTTNPPNTNGNYMFSNLTIPNNTTLIVASGTKIQVNGAFVNNGTIEVKECSEGNRPAAHSSGTPYPLVKGTTLTQQFAYPEEQLRFLSSTSILLGGSNGSQASGTDITEEGGGGGGILTINALTISNNSTGLIKANGGDGFDQHANSAAGGPGGGGGGYILLQCNTITNTGNIEAKGGKGADHVTHHGGGGGGGGLVRIIATNANSVAGTINVAEGIGGSGPVTPNNTDGGNGGAGVGGNGGLGGGFDSNTQMEVPADPGLVGKVVLTTVPDPCSVLK